jgi:hypothetical protein
MRILLSYATLLMLPLRSCGSPDYDLQITISRLRSLDYDLQVTSEISRLRASNHAGRLENKPVLV